jgi:hypothetical protein
MTALTAALSIIGPIIAVAVWWVGWQQMQIARVKLQYELYERRVRAFDAARRYLMDQMGDYDEVEAAKRDFDLAAAGALFLFNSDIHTTLRDLDRRVSRFLRTDKKQRADTTPEGAARQKADFRVHLDWSSDQYDLLVTKFTPFLALPEIRTVPSWMERLWRRLQRQ